MGKIRNMLLGPALLGDVVEDGEQIFRFTALVPDCDLAGLDQALPVAERFDAMFRRRDDTAGLQRFVIGPHDHVGAQRREYFVRGFSDQADTAIAREFFIGAIEQCEPAALHVGSRALHVPDDDRHRDVLDHGIEEDLCAAKLGFGLLGLGDVMDHRQARSAAIVGERS